MADKRWEEDASPNNEDIRRENPDTAERLAVGELERRRLGEGSGEP